MSKKMILTRNKRSRLVSSSKAAISSNSIASELSDVVDNATMNHMYNIDDYSNDDNKKSAYNDAGYSKSNEVDDVLLQHQRKIQRRQANRKSAQLSRARKKAQLAELQAQNLKYARLVNILESHPDILFTCNAYGQLHYLSERGGTMLNVNGMCGEFKVDNNGSVATDINSTNNNNDSNKSSVDELDDHNDSSNTTITTTRYNEPMNISQFLVPESLNIFYNMIQQLSSSSSGSGSGGSDNGNGSSCSGSGSGSGNEEDSSGAGSKGTTTDGGTSNSNSTPPPLTHHNTTNSHTHNYSSNSNVDEDMTKIVQYRGSDGSIASATLRCTVMKRNGSGSGSIDYVTTQPYTTTTASNVLTSTEFQEATGLAAVVAAAGVLNVESISSGGSGVGGSVIDEDMHDSSDGGVKYVCMLRPVYTDISHIGSGSGSGSVGGDYSHMSHAHIDAHRRANPITFNAMGPNTGVKSKTMTINNSSSSVGGGGFSAFNQIHNINNDNDDCSSGESNDKDSHSSDRPNSSHSSQNGMKTSGSDDDNGSGDGGDNDSGLQL